MNSLREEIFKTQLIVTLFSLILYVAIAMLVFLRRSFFPLNARSRLTLVGVGVANFTFVVISVAQVRSVRPSANCENETKKSCSVSMFRARDRTGQCFSSTTFSLH